MHGSAANILVFDSGVGGLSIVNHLRRTLTPSNLIYLADNLLFPYGLLQEQTLVERVCELVTTSAAAYDIDVIIIACNSASTLVLPQLRKLIEIPIVGVVPAIKPAALQSVSKVIGLLATPGTIRRDYTDALIGDFAQGCEIIRVGSPELVQIVEQKMAGAEIPPQVFVDVLAPFRNHPQWLAMDTIVLACTHFPLIEPELRAAAPEINYWVDSGAAIARRVKQLIDEHRVTQLKPRQADIALVSSLPALSPALQANFKRFGFAEILSW